MNIERHYHQDGTVPDIKENKCWVFGSNLAGRHGAGAAFVAAQVFGAQYGQGRGMLGQSYAIPTKDFYLRSLPLRDIEEEVRKFCEFTQQRKDLKFFVTSVGCGLAGYHPSRIAPFFRTAVNCSFPTHWQRHLETPL